MEHLGPCTLVGKFVRLEPLRMRHMSDLLQAGKGFDWAWMSQDLTSLESMTRWIDEAALLEKKGEAYTFAVALRDSEKIIGSTRYMEVREEHRGCEIGWTWYAPSFWGTFVNPECKFLLLKHAFEDWKALRVELKTDNNNVHSQKAILKLDAKFEGRLRNHRIRRDGTLRDTMLYSITEGEWPEVKSSLEKRIETFEARLPTRSG